MHHGPRLWSKFCAALTKHKAGNLKVVRSKKRKELMEVGGLQVWCKRRHSCPLWSLKSSD